MLKTRTAVGAHRGELRPECDALGAMRKRSGRLDWHCHGRALSGGGAMAAESIIGIFAVFGTSQRPSFVGLAAARTIQRKARASALAARLSLRRAAGWAAGLTAAGLGVSAVTLLHPRREAPPLAEPLRLVSVMQQQPQQAFAPAADMELTSEFAVELHCDGCARSVRAALARLPALTVLNISVEQQTVVTKGAL